MRKLNNGIVFARPLNNSAILKFTAFGVTRECQQKTFFDIRQPIIISTLDDIALSFSGEWIVESLTLSQVTTLFSFLDFQSEYRRTSSQRSNRQGKDDDVLMRSERQLAFLVDEKNKTFVAIAISSLLNPQDFKMECLFSFIRNLESYWITHFLLSQLMNEDKESDNHKICNASKIYGVSESYFRKLCHHAFTRGPKKQLRMWRAAHSVLQLIDNDKSISIIAGDNGYASASHFSSEIKSLFGITPREFKKLEGLLHE